jgi:cytochrome c-type biogenesis protein CcmF
MENIGSFALLLALALAAYSLLGSVIGAVTKRSVLVKSAQRATMVMWAMVTIGVVCLETLILTDQFRMAYVAAHSNKELPFFYKITSLWAGQEGSLLFWSWLLSCYAMAVVVLHRKPSPGVAPLMPYVNAVLMASQVFFLWLNNVVASPFHLLLATGAGAVNMAVPDGSGLNPLLQHPAMVIHPPMLYLGYVGFAVPFAFAAATLIVKPRGEEWIHVTRKWTMVTWLFQGCGVLLGARWAYAVLGWGGYWGWDPVENASLMPWLTGTAFLHSVMMQEKKGMLKVWNMALVFLTYFLCIFGTFLTRSGVVSSVHAFARSPIGPYFAGLLIVLFVFCAVLLITSRKYLRSENQLESLVSRESSFLFNNLVLLAACFAVLWGTMFPVISEAIQGTKISVGAPFFNKVNIPVGLFLMFLTGVGPLLAWRKNSLDGLRRNFMVPAIIGVVAAVAIFAFGARSFFAITCLALCTFVTATIAQEFYKGASVIARKLNVALPKGVFELTMRNTRRYGGYVVHMGMVLIFVGLAGSAFNAELETEMKVGSSATLRNYKFECVDMKDIDTPNYAALSVVIDVYKDGDKIMTMTPERRMYKASKQPVSIVNIRERLNEDLYMVFLGPGQEPNTAGVHIYINPLVMWIWLGGFTMIIGTGLALFPSRRVLQAAPQREAVLTPGQTVRA